MLQASLFVPVAFLLTTASIIGASINTQLTFGPGAAWRSRGPLASSMRWGHSEADKPKYRQRTIWTPSIWGINLGKRGANLEEDGATAANDLGSMQETPSEARRRDDVVRMFSLVGLINSAGATAAQ
ncbi:hypothetical protein RvY_11137 [Ramazzottius varieornatus]|uniref:Uncharacterized protein n=1 Tax=Ramazzottius varieornatus TaxID=947166 RepID=A0A1D1VF69_RAMVA|nr:hypothetical protein RvY_11137 [Ramazzottius varieornatus]